MSTELVELNPEHVDPGQLVLPDETFSIVSTLSNSGVITPTSFLLDDPTMEYDNYAMIVRWVGLVNRSCAWWMGDLLNFGEGTYGERYAQAASETGLSEQTLLQRAMVCRAIPLNYRKVNLSFRSHLLVHRLDKKAMKYWLDRASKHGWTAQQLAEAMKAHRTDTEPPLDDVGRDPIDESAVVEVARAIAAHAEEAEDGDYRVRREDIVRLRAVLGQED